MLLLALNLERAMFVLLYYPWLLLFPFSSTPLNIKGNNGGNIVQLGLNYSSDINTYYWINSETMPHFRYVIQRLIAEEKKKPKKIHGGSDRWRFPADVSRKWTFCVSPALHFGPRKHKLNRLILYSGCAHPARD